MAKQIINVGTSENSKNGDPIRTSFIKVNSNFTELYSSLSAGTQSIKFVPPPSSSIGATGDLAGSISFDVTGIYFCTHDYNGSDIWVKSTWDFAGTWP